MPNKIHRIIEGIENMDSVDAKHTFRVGLIANTLMASLPVCIEDLPGVLCEDKGLNINVDKIRDKLPMLIEFNHGYSIAILIVVDKDSTDIQCYPFSNNNPEKEWIPYDIAFIIEDDYILQLRVVNSWVIHADPSQEVITHMESLASIVRCFLYKLSEGLLSIYDMNEDHSIINKKRISRGRTPILRTFGVK